MLLLVTLCACIGMWAQVRVTGVVYSAEDDEPLIGATVAVKGKPAIATSTDLDGNFTLSVPSAGSTLVVTYVGMKPAEVKASSSPLTIKLESNAQQLGEVVVTGMSKMDKRLFTGATTKIDAEDARLSGVSDISRSLEGLSLIHI